MYCHGSYILQLARTGIFIGIQIYIGSYLVKVYSTVFLFGEDFFKPEMHDTVKKILEEQDEMGCYYKVHAWLDLSVGRGICMKFRNYTN